MTVATTILEQLGGNKFIAMTGARHFMADNDALYFSLPAGASRGINRVSIYLAPSDTYTMHFHKLRGTDVKKIAERDLVYADQLGAVFKTETGLDVSL